MSEQLPGKGFFGWLGRQVGHVKKAVQTDPAAQRVAYRKEKVEEIEHPEDPGMKLRRTTIDEVIVRKELPRTEGGSGGEASKT
jgi:hypothetical protein